MIIFGKNSDDKGTQLEALTKILLDKLGYTNIATNEISAGGEEIDVTGEYYIPSVGERKVCKLICECKAYKNATNMDQWLKFLGKVFVEEARRNQEIYGVFIALSNVNGYVKGNYEDIKLHRQNITIVTGEGLIELLAKLYPILNARDIYDNVKKYTDRYIIGSEICYYESKVYYLVNFEHGEFSLLDFKGVPIKAEELDVLREALIRVIDIDKYIDLQREDENTKRRHYIQKKIISGFVIDDGKLQLNKLINEDEMVTIEDLRREGQEVCERVGLILDENDVLILNSPQGGTAIEVIVKIYRELLNGGILVEALGSNFYDNYIDHNLVAEICKMQEGLELDDEETNRTIELLRLTPSGLLSFLYPDNMIVTHRKQLGGTDFNDEDKRYFFNTLYTCLKRDYHNIQLHKYFYEVRDIREIETNQEVIVKTSKKPILNVQIPERFGIGRLTEEYGGQLVALLALKDSPQPWERLKCSTEEKK